MTRDDKGRFVKGHANLGAGRKPKPIEEYYLDIFKSAVSEQDWLDIINVAKTQAKRGDAVARKFIADYLIGTPIQKTEHTGKDGGIIRVTLKAKDD